MIRFENVSYKYSNSDRENLTGLNFEFHKGDTVLVLGENGSGKTTLLSLISNLIFPDSGSVKLFGMNTKEKNFEKIFRRKIGYVFQTPYNSLLNRTVFEEVVWILKNYGIDNEEEKYSDCMRSFGLNPEGMKNRNPMKLSLSEKKKISIVSNIIHDPSVLLVDEPNILFDYYSYRSLINIFNEYKNKNNVLIIATNYPENFIFLANKIVYLKDKTISFFGNTKDFFQEGIFFSKELEVVKNYLWKNGHLPDKIEQYFVDK